MDKYIPHDLESNPLLLKTNSSVGSGDEIRVKLRAPGFNIMHVSISFTNPPKLYIQHCTRQEVELALPTGGHTEERIWRISKTDDSLVFTSSGYAVANITYADYGSECVGNWSTTNIVWLYFDSDYNNATLHYIPEIRGRYIKFISLTL